MLQIEGLAICSEVMEHNEMPGHCTVFSEGFALVDLKALFTEIQKEEMMGNVFFFLTSNLKLEEARLMRVSLYT